MGTGEGDEAEDARLGLHLSSCPRCASREARDARLADPLVLARGAALGLRSVARRTASVAVAGLRDRKA